MQLARDALPTHRGSEDPDQNLAFHVAVCLSLAHHIERAGREAWSDDRIDQWCSLYNAGRRIALAMPATTDTGRAALAVLAMADMPRGSVRVDNDPAGMAFLALAEDLIAKIM